MEENKRVFQENLRLKFKMERKYFIGIDIGTQGARIALLDEEGYQHCVKEEVFPFNTKSKEEQSPLEWWDSCYRSLFSLCNEVKTSIDLSSIKAMSVTSTSGTIIPLDKDNQPLHDAIMYSDPRSADEAKLCKEAALSVGYKGYSAFNSSSGLPKMLWFLNAYPEKAKKVNLFIHATDFIVGKLSGHFSITDYTNALKSGYDVKNLQWPAYIFEKLPLKKEWMQQVKPPGEPIGYIIGELARELGLSPRLIITTGMTDGCASQVASGAVNLGDWNTTIGTTLVVKGVTKNEIVDPSGALYCHRHPGGYWMPGGASNTGADWVSKLYKEDELDELNKKAAALIPTGQVAWPLIRQGERFPFIAPYANGFAPEDISRDELFTAYMEGVAYIERYAYKKINELSGEAVKQIFSAGGASNSDTWLHIRSNVLNLPIRKMKNVSGAAGAAILAASKTYFDSLTEAAQAMTRPEKLVQPETGLATVYENNYRHFIDTLKEKGYIPKTEYA